MYILIVYLLFVIQKVIPHISLKVISHTIIQSWNNILFQIINYLIIYFNIKFYLIII